MNQSIICFLPVFLGLTACSISPRKGLDKSPGSLQYQQQISHLNQYQTHGAFVYLSDQKKVYARFFWEKTGLGNYHLLLLNLLGNTELVLNAQPGQVELIDNKGQHYIAVNVEEMIEKLTGMLLPFNNLCHWILGLPGDSTEYKLDEHYRLRELNYSQNGKTWKVVYGRYDAKTIPTLTLPSSMEMSEDGHRIKLKMDKWIVK